MPTDKNVPKKGDKIKSSKKIKVVGNNHIKVLSSAGPDTLDKGVKGQIYKFDNKHIYASFYWYSKAKFDLDLRVDTTFWGGHFEKQ